MNDIFAFLYDRLYFDINKPIRLFEAFSGIGTQAMALKRLGYQVDHIGISEIDKHAIKSYNAIHGEVKNYGGIGSFERMPKNIDICSWSFPCQDISLAGKQRGMVDGSRSNYGYVFLDTIENTPYEERPKVLLMENVKALLSATFSEDWKEINLRLERLGYKNYANSLIATDFGVPQTRDRVFIVSIKGDYSYTFPKPFKLNKKLKDYLETKVDEKYYLSDKQIEQIVNWKAYNKPLENARNEEDDEVIQTITAKSNTSMNSSMILIKEATKQGYSIAEYGDGIYINRPHQKRGVVQKDKIQTIKTSVNDIGVVVEDNRNAKEKLADDLIASGVVKGGEIIHHSYVSSKTRLELKDFIETDNGIVPTLTTRLDTLGVVVKDERIKEHQMFDYRSSEKFARELGNEIVPTLKTKNHIAIAVKETENYLESNVLGSIDNTRRAWKEDKVIGTITTKSDTSKVLLNYKNFEAKQNEEDEFALLNRYSEITNKLYEEKLKRKELNLKIANDPNLSIRKLTPLESWRLMGIDDEDFYKAKASGMSDSQLYKQAGNAIVVDVLYYIFKQFIKGEKDDI